jgi:hypothetical protein
MTKITFLPIATLVATTFVSAQSRATTCGNSNPACDISINTGSGPAFAALSNNDIAVIATGGTYGVGAFGVQRGVSGSSLNGSGIFGESNSGNAVYGKTSSTTSAAVSADTTSDSSLAYWGRGGIVITGSFAQKSGGGAWTGLSDERIKKDVKNFRQGLAELERVRPVSFKYNGLGGTEDSDKEYVGVIAQELEKVLPAMVSEKRAKLRKDDADETGIKQVDPSAFTYLLINAVQEQHRIIEQQDARIARLERGRTPLMSSLVPYTFGSVGLCLLPLGLVAAHRKRRRSKD